MSIVWITNEIFLSTPISLQTETTKLSLYIYMYTARDFACAELQAVEVGGASVKTCSKSSGMQVRTN